MLLDFEDTGTPDTLEADVVVIGAGAVGLSIYADLLRNGQDAILLEAGGSSLDMRSQSVIRSATNTGHFLEGLHVGRYRYLGGTTNFWAGQLIEFDPIVFEERPWLGLKGWLFGKDTLKPYYRKAMAHLGMGTALENDEAVWQRSGITPPKLADDVDYFFTRWIKIANFAKLFQKDIQSSAGKVVLNANAVGFAKPLNGKGHAVRIRTFDGRQGTVYGRKIVLALGTIETSRLLLLPYEDGAATPWSQNPWLGRAYIDHLDFNVGDVTPIDHDRFSNLFENMFYDGHKYNPKIKLSEKAQRERQFVGAAGAFIYSTSYKEHSDNVKLFIRSIVSGKMPSNLGKLPGHILSLWRVAVPMVYRYLRSSRMFHPKGSSIFLRITSEQVPLAESRITLKDEKDQLGVPTINVHWQVDGRELETVAYFAETVSAGLKAQGLAELTVNPLLAARDPEFLKQGDDTNHQMGGCRMGANPDDGLVDANCKVFGADDIYVAGAAVMPASGFPNCTLTSIALGLRLSEHLRSAS